MKLYEDKPKAVASASASGISFFGLLGVLFIGLKLTGHINWSWLWVLAPIWIPMGLTTLLALVILALLIQADKAR
jgi:hypothetical protein